jgi:hypothetical protein
MPDKLTTTPIQKVLAKIKPVWIARVGSQMARGMEVGDNFEEQLELFFELLTQSVITGDPAWLDSILLGWAKSSDETDPEEQYYHVSFLINRMIALTIQVGHENLTKREANDFLTATMPVLTYALGILSRYEMEVRVAGLSEELESQARSNVVNATQRVKDTSYKKYALIIGNNFYEDEHFTTLNTPQEDVLSLVEILRNPAIGGFSDVKSLVNQTSSTVGEAIEDFCADRSREDLMLLYFSGHGILDDQGRLYLATCNTRYNRPRGRSIPSHAITESLDSSRCKRQILILDCCHSGAFHRGTKGSGGIGQKAVTRTTFAGDGSGRVVLTATNATQYAWENDQFVGEAINSVFTHFLIQGLETGEADLDGDGGVTVDELYDYVYQQIRHTVPKQTPERWTYRQEGSFFIANNPSIR